MSYRHRLFGISEPMLRRELRRRRRVHRAALIPLRAELARQKRLNAELRQYLALLGTEVISLEEEERRLAQNDPLDAQRQTLQQYRALQDHLIGSVLSLIAPFLSAVPSGMHPKEERTWPKTPSEDESGSAGP
ncbi:MAG TPA: hypothetical protein VD973_16285 [Symbiobacteriaceae bacterium]|jgi:hypothetical protein|nr:hypothetical protein [Symbiobacteriaceae bacterium]